MRRVAMYVVVSLMLAHVGWAQQTAMLSGQVINLRGEPLEDIFVYLKGTSRLAITDEEGRFKIEVRSGQTHTLTFQSIKISRYEQTAYIEKDTFWEIKLKEEVQSLDEVVVESASDAFGMRQLRSTEDGGLYEGKKSEVINVEELIVNKAANNARQAFSKIPSLNIWESDFAGLQLDIGGRGLSPKRTSNFNTRQNGYDISADALGYPESYYTPPLQAVRQIEVIRGAGALQYGSQFGGLVNFKMKRGNPNKPVNVESQNTYGAFGFFNTFNAFHGQTKKLNHYSYVYYKRGDGWRPNSDFEQYGAFSSLDYQASDKLKIGFDITYMYYLSQQAGGLTDEKFAQDPQQSTRARNWFRVSWTLPALTLEYQLSDNVKIYNRTFGLIARRSSLGMLTTPDNPDIENSSGAFKNRDLIDGKFRNVGNETRIVFTYDTKTDLKNSLLLGTRVFRGFTNFSQYLGTKGFGADFTEADTAIVNRRKSDFDFPSFNAAVFVEKIIRLTSSFSLIPGIRYEYIDTQSEGVLTTPVRVTSFGEVVEQDSTVENSKQRNIFLYGLGISKKLKDKYELYVNATANYRAINFTDIQIQTNTQLVDTLIQDENGYSFDVGVRRMDFDPFFLEVGIFYLLYNDRIGEVLDDGLRVRTNIGSGRIFGVELFFEVDVLRVLRRTSEHTVSLFVNGSVNRGVYTKINERSASVVRSGRRLEDIPTYNVKTGVAYGYKRFSTTVLATFVGEQFSDARNTRVQISTLAETTGVFGEIPAYFVMDFSAKYQFNEMFKLTGSINNVLDKSYFTRRATAYPGPGIIPALGRTWNLTLSIKL